MLSGLPGAYCVSGPVPGSGIQLPPRAWEQRQRRRAFSEPSSASNPESSFLVPEG